MVASAAVAAGRARVRIGIDTGGTFTDVVAIDESTGRITTTKVPSTPANPADGFLDGITKILAAMKAVGSDIAAISHGTTVATNQLLQGQIGRVGLITNEGYEFLLEIARQSVPDGYGNSYFWVKPPRIVPVDRVRTVRGRLDHTGREIMPFDEASARAAAEFFASAGVDAVGVCLLHSYANPAHEHRMREVLGDAHPKCIVSLSSDVLREYREYERAVTTIIDVAVKPGLARYVTSIRERLESVAASLPFYVMKSNGGVLSASEVTRQPITTVLSGPAAGALGAAMIGDLAGHRSVLTLDGGGTSTDVSVILDGRPTLTTEGSVGGHSCKIPMIDIVTVGAGGGSIALASPEGALKVGPRSAGADPGPICYCRGGDEPTVTDAHVVLGRIPPHLLGGEITLDRDAAAQGISRLAAQLGLSDERAAAGILEVSAWNQANAIREATVKRGIDLRELAMVAFGGSGPLLVCRLVDLLGLPAVIVPPNPGNLSALGLLTVDVRNDYVQTIARRDDELGPATLRVAYEDLATRADTALADEGFAPFKRRFVRTADLRYAGQAYEVRVDAPGGDFDDHAQTQTVTAFHDAHERLYGYAYRGDRERNPVEWVNLRVTGIGMIPRPEIAARSPRSMNRGRPAPAVRRVFFDEWVKAAVVRRDDLAPGDDVVGPAVIEEFGSTVPVHPGFGASVDTYGNLVVTSR
jgi:N-methylhydantoinase A